MHCLHVDLNQTNENVNCRKLLVYEEIFLPTDVLISSQRKRVKILIKIPRKNVSTSRYTIFLSGNFSKW